MASIPKIRQWIWTFLAKRKINGYKGSLKCNHYCSFNCNTFCGYNCNFNGIRVMGRGKVVIGDNFHSGGNVQIITSYHNYDFGNAIPYDDTFITRDVTIGDNVWIGNNVIILAGATIGNGAIIQAGSVVCGSVIPELAIAGGHPAKVFKYRNKEHYEELLYEQKYY